MGTVNDTCLKQRADRNWRSVCVYVWKCFMKNKCFTLSQHDGLRWKHKLTGIFNFLCNNQNVNVVDKHWQWFVNTKCLWLTIWHGGNINLWLVQYRKNRNVYTFSYNYNQHPTQFTHSLSTPDECLAGLVEGRWDLLRKKCQLITKTTPQRWTIHKLTHMKNWVIF